MRSYNHIGLICVALLLFVVIKICIDNKTAETVLEFSKTIGRHIRVTAEGGNVVEFKPGSTRGVMYSHMIDQRNNLSKLLNLKQKKIGQLQCESTDKAKTSATGGWCEERSKENHHMTDKKLVPALTEFFTGKYVGSFGDGPGRYKQELTDSGKVKGYDAYDGAPFCETTSEGRVMYLDLTLPQYGLPVYDWVLSLEVAEHIPAEYENIFVDNIVRHAKEGIVLSWARPGQGGYSHINNKNSTYVIDLFKKLGFSHDNGKSEHLKKSSSFGWFRNNINVYMREVALSNEEMTLNS